MPAEKKSPLAGILEEGTSDTEDDKIILQPKSESSNHKVEFLSRPEFDARYQDIQGWHSGVNHQIASLQQATIMLRNITALALLVAAYAALKVRKLSAANKEEVSSDEKEVSSKDSDS